MPATVATRVNPPVVPVGTPSAYAEDLSCDGWLGRVLFELGTVSPDRVENDSKLPGHSDRGTLPADAFFKPQGPGLERTIAPQLGHEHTVRLVEITA